MNNFPRYHFTHPPRRVPWLVRGQQLFGGFSGSFGWLWFGFSMIFIWIFGSMVNLNGFYFLFNDMETAPGVVTVIEGTNASENETPVYANHYAFRVERLETEYLGVSYTTGRKFSPNQEVIIEYLADDPEISRIQGARPGIFSPWIFCLLGIFPGIGLVAIVGSFISGLKANYLLTHGKVALGRLIDKTPTNTRINDQTVYKLTFEFTADDGRSYQAVARSHIPYNLEDEDQEELLYNPNNPAKAVLLDNLPGSLDIDDYGNLYAANSSRAIGVFFLPAVVLLGNGAAYLIFVVL